MVVSTSHDDATLKALEAIDTIDVDDLCPVLVELEGRDHNLTNAEWAELQVGLAPLDPFRPYRDGFGERPLAPSGKLVTRDNDFLPEELDDPQPYVEVMARRVEAGYRPKHPDDVVVEDLDAPHGVDQMGRLSHNLANGHEAQGRLIRWPLFWRSRAA